MALTVYKFADLVSNIATAMQGSATARLNFSVGSTLRAISEAFAGVILWLQAIILQLLTLTRAATSQGADLDSFNADYGLTRLPANAATGQVTFSRFTPSMAALIPAGSGVQTSDGSQKFIVTLDATNAAYSPNQGGYIIPAGTASLNVPVIAANPGTQGNIQAASITQITGGIPYVDIVSNAAAYINGIDAESDPAYRARFVLYLASLSKGTKAAVDYAAKSVQQGVTDQILENQNYDLSANKGFFTVIIDDGSGYPSTSLINAVTAAVDAVRALTVSFGVFAPTVATANVTMTLTTATGYTHLAVVNAVSAALANAINAIPLGSGLPYSKLASIAYGVPGVLNASGILLDGGTADIAADPRYKVIAGSMTVA